MACPCGGSNFRSAEAKATVEGHRYILSYIVCNACGRVGSEVLFAGEASIAHGNNARALFQRVQSGEPLDEPTPQPVPEIEKADLPDSQDTAENRVQALVRESIYHPYKYLFGPNKEKIRAIMAWTGNIAYQACPDLGIDVSADDPLKAWELLYEKLAKALDLPDPFVFAMTCAPPFDVAKRQEPPKATEAVDPAPIQDHEAPADAEGQLALF